MYAASRISPLASAPFLDRYEMTRTVADRRSPFRLIFAQLTAQHLPGGLKVAVPENGR